MMPYCEIEWQARRVPGLEVVGLMHVLEHQINTGENERRRPDGRMNGGRVMFGRKGCQSLHDILFLSDAFESSSACRWLWIFLLNNKTAVGDRTCCCPFGSWWRAGRGRVRRGWCGTRNFWLLMNWSSAVACRCRC